jgi:DNA invertase Pin-like site-specific DNA recombinase
MAEGRFIAYHRVSTAQQGRSGLGLEAQRQAVAEYLNGGAWTLLAEYTEVESGKRADRPELAKALAACRAHRAVLAIAKLDRLARDAHFLLGLQKAGVEFVATDMPTANRLTVGIMALVAEEEARMISARTKAALAEAKKRRQAAGLPGLGGARITVSGQGPGERGREHVATARAARGAKTMAFCRDVKPYLLECFAVGITSHRAIAAELNRRHVAARQGGAWSHVAVAAQLRRLEIAA